MSDKQTVVSVIMQRWSIDYSKIQVKWPLSNLFYLGYKAISFKIFIPLLYQIRNFYFSNSTKKKY